MRGTWGVAFGLLWAVEAAAVPVTVTHQGRLLDATGAPIDGSRDLTVSLWSHASSTDAGTYRTYNEQFSAVPLESGTYSVVLGSTGGLDASALAGDRWVEVAVDTTPLVPRTKLTSVPSAANTVGANLSALDGITRLCPNGTHQTFSGATGTWSACPANWTCASDPSHGGCVSSSTYTTCKAIDDDPTFIGTSANYFIDPDGAGNGVAPFQTWCDVDNAGGGWTRIGIFDGTTETPLTHSQAQAIPFMEARIAMNGASTIQQINCYATPTINGLQTTSTDRQCTQSAWFIRFNITSPATAVAQGGNFGFYRGALSANNGGCSWGTATFIFGRHHNGPSGICRFMGQGEQYETPNNWNGNTFWMYVR